MTPAFGMPDQLFDLLGVSRTLKLNRECDAFERRSGSFQPHLVGHVERATDIHLAVFDRHFVKMREPRNLRQQSERRAHQEIGQRRGSQVAAAPLLRFVGL